MDVAKLKPWAMQVFELLMHAKRHRIAGEDLDRRTAFIEYGRAIEISIATYLDLHPLQREGLVLRKADTEKWLVNDVTKLEFLEYYVISIRQERMAIGRDEILYFHRIRNDLYHGSPAYVPSLHDIEDIRAATLWSSRPFSRPIQSHCLQSSLPSEVGSVAGSWRCMR
jgi:hypothetical protein